MTEELRVLLLDDEESVRAPLKRYLQNNFGFQVDAAANGSDAVALVDQAHGCYDVALLDEVLRDDWDGVQVMQEIKKRYPDVECIIFTGWGFESAMRALRAGAYRYLAKPVNVEELGMLIRMTAEHSRLKRELQITRQEKEWLQTFLEIGRATTSVLELDQVLEEVRVHVGRLIDVSGLHVILYDDKTQTLQFELCFDRGQKQPEWRRFFAEGQGLTEWVISKRQPLLLHDYPNDAPVPACEHHYGEESDQEVAQSWLGVPLIVRDKAIGAITVQSYQPRQFSETDQQILATVASQVAIGIKNAQLFSSLEEASESLKGLIASSFDAVIAIDRDEHITVFNRQAENLFGYRADEVQGHSVVRLHRAIEEARKIHEMVSQQGVVHNYETTLRDKAGNLIPVRLSAVSIRDAVGNEIGQAGFMHDVRQLRTLEDRLEALVQVGQVISSTLDLEEVYELIVRTAVAAFPNAQKGALHLFDVDSGLLRIKASVGYPAEIAETVVLKVGEGRAGWVYKHAAPLNVGNVQTHELTKLFAYPQEFEQKSTLCVPILLRHQPIGALSVDSVTEYDAFDPADVGILSTLANQAATAIENARLYGTARRRMEELDRLRAVGQAIVERVTARPKDVLDQIAMGACQVIGADSAIIYPLLTETQAYDVENIGSYRLLSDKGFDAAKRRSALGSMTGIVLQQGLVVVDDVSARVDRSGQVEIHTRAGSFLRREGVKSFVGVSLTFGGEPMGALFVNFRQAHRFADDELSLITILANQAAGAIRQAQLFEQVTRVRESARQVAQASALGDLTPTLESIVKAARLVLRCDVVTLHAFDERLQRFTQVVADGYLQQKHIRQPDQITSSSVLWNILDLQESYYHFAVDVSGDSLLRGDFVEKEKVKSSLGILLRYEAWRVGVMFVNYRTLHHFSSDELADAQLFANQAAIAIYNARLYDDLQRRSRHQEALYEASKAIAAGFLLERERVLDSIVEQAVERVTGVHGCKATWGAIQLYDVETNELTFESVYAPENPGLRSRLGERWPVDKGRATDGRIGITGRAVLVRMPKRVSDVRSDPDYVDFDPTTEAELDVPLFDGNKVIGILGVESDRPRAFDEEDERALQALAELAVIAIKNAKQAEQLSRTTAVAVMGAWGADVVHDVNREVGAIRRITFALQQQPGLPAQVKDGLQKVDTYAASLALPELPEEPLQTGHILEFRDAPLLDLVVGAEVEYLQGVHSPVSIKLELGAVGIQVAMHELWLRRLLRHLVNNAVQATSDKTTRVITVRTLVQGMIAEVQVEDTGKGVRPEIEATLFRSEVRHQDQRPGRGLVLVDFLARQHGGKARLLWSRPGEGACFAFTIPMAKRLHDERYDQP